MKVLVIAAHPDDEIIGCGATIAKHIREGDEVKFLILGDGVTARYDENELENPEVIEKVKNLHIDAVDAAKIVGVENVQIEGIHCARFDKVPLINITKIIEKTLYDFQPKRVYTHSPLDANNDHQIIFKAVQIATRPISNKKYYVEEIFLMEILSSTEWNFVESFRPDYYVNIEDTIELKIKSMGIYSTEGGKFPYPRSSESIMALSKKRGTEVGLKNAEAFKVLRIINK